MHRFTGSVIAVVMLVGVGIAHAEDKAAAQGPDMSKMGPWARKPKNDKPIKKEVEAFFKAEEELMKKGDFDGVMGRIDFPMYMVTDDSKGVAKAEEWSKEKYAAEMKPMWEGMPKDMKMTHKYAITVLSESLVVFADDFTMIHGKQKMPGRSSGVLIKKDGQWKWKSGMEAGWGDPPPAAPAAPAPAAAAPAAPPAK